MAEREAYHGDSDQRLGRSHFELVLLVEAAIAAKLDGAVSRDPSQILDLEGALFQFDDEHELACGLVAGMAMTLLITGEIDRRAPSCHPTIRP